MSSRHLASSDDGARDRAVQRLRAAVAERKRLNDALESAGSKPDDVKVITTLRTTDDGAALRGSDSVKPGAGS